MTTVQEWWLATPGDFLFSKFDVSKSFCPMTSSSLFLRLPLLDVCPTAVFYRLIASYSHTIKVAGADISVFGGGQAAWRHAGHFFII